MRKTSSSGRASQYAKRVRDRIEQGGERIWRFEDFRDFPTAAVAQALSRLAREGFIERLSKGIYYRSRPTVFGKSLPNPAAIQKLVSEREDVFPSGISAANLLGFTTQTARRGEVATSARSLPRKLLGPDVLIHTHRPEAWAPLSDSDAALLDFLRRGGSTSELSPKETTRKTLDFLSEKGRFQRLARVAESEPPRVRAILGALGDALGVKPALLGKLRQSLNPLSRFDFGAFSTLSAALQWQAKKRRT